MGGGTAWAAALELALMLNEIARVPAERVETREGATSAMFGLDQADLMVSLDRPGDPLGDEALRLCAATGTHTLQLPSTTRPRARSRCLRRRGASRNRRSLPRASAAGAAPPASRRSPAALISVGIAAMRFTLLLAAIVAALALAAPAQAVTLLGTDGAPLGGRLQAVVDRSRVPTAPGTVAIDLHPCPGTDYDGCWDATVLHLPTARGVDIRWTLMHELGHVFDDRVLTAADRSAFKRIIRDTAPWSTGVEPAGERFAEAYAGCAIYAHAPYGGLQGEYGYQAGPETFRRVCDLIRRAAAR